MKMSLDQLDRASFHAGPAPIDSCGEKINLTQGTLSVKPADTYSLNGEWEFLESDDDNWESCTEWPADTFCGEVPGTVHSALLKAGRIADPFVGQNQVEAREHCFHSWWLRKHFSFSSQNGKRYLLAFDGIADRCTIWLNQHKIASHQGMFGGPEIDVTDFLKEKNVLVVKLEPIPYRHWEGPIVANNKSWEDTVVINNVYGWHYFNLPSLGIWKPVYIKESSKIELLHPFVFTRDAFAGQIGLVMDISSPSEASVDVDIEIKPFNFEDVSYVYHGKAICQKGIQSISYDIQIPSPKLWWPNGLGKPNLYQLTIAVHDLSDSSVYQNLFGIRSIQMDPLPEGPDEKLYNWSFVINGKKMFVKGANWCTMDALLDLSKERYERFLTLAKNQHIQILRAWGAGMPETDTFYQLCSMYGIMVLQEWPTAWNSHKVQPIDILEDTVTRNTFRIRNYPALVMYGAGNESSDPFGPAIDMMGRLSIELDGTRPYHRGQPWGGSKHDYLGYWFGYHLDHHLNAVCPFWGEFGYASIPNYESFCKYMPPESLSVWPLENNPDFIMHTPCFGFRDDLNHIRQSANYFLPKSYKWKEFIISTQLTHALAVRRVLERARTRHPDCAGAIYYKLTDNSPAVSWACVDYYGVPKIPYYVIQDSFEPLHACILFERTSFQQITVSLPVYLLDDANTLGERSWEVDVKAYGADLSLVAQEKFHQRLPEKYGNQIGTFDLSMHQTDTAPLFVTCDLILEGKRISRSFYFSNFEQQRGCIFELPRAAIETSRKEGRITVKNISNIPVVGLWMHSPGEDHLTTYSDNFLWLEPDESVSIEVTGVDTNRIKIEALNLM